MDLDPKYIGAWKQLDGSDGADPDGGTDLVCLHVSDLHGQLVPQHHVYYDNPESRPHFDFGDDDRILRRGGGIPLLAAKLAEIRSAADETLTLMTGFRLPIEQQRTAGTAFGTTELATLCRFGVRRLVRQDSFSVRFGKRHADHLETPREPTLKIT